MRKRRNADQIAKMLSEFDKELAKGFTVHDICRKAGICETTYYRWRQKFDPQAVANDAERRCKALESEVERLKKLVVELLLDKQLLQDVAQKKW